MREKPSFISQQVTHGRYFFLDLAPPSDVELAVVCGGREQCTPGYDVARRGFQYYALELVVEGEGHLQLAGETYPLRAGSVFTYGPHVAHRIQSSASRSLVKYFIDFTGTEAPSPAGHDGHTPQPPHQLIRTRWIHDIFDQLLDAGSLPRNLARTHCELLLRLLLMRLEVDAQPHGEARSAAFSTYCRCRRYIEDHFRTTTGVAEVASACGVAPAYLSRLFRRFSQEGPLQHLTRLKMDAAADLLAWRGYSVAQAARAVGFPDPYHFSRVFKRVHGIAPRDFAVRLDRRVDRQNEPVATPPR